MKGQDKGKGNVVERDDWQTPQDLFDALDRQYRFGFDCCACDTNRKCRRFAFAFEQYDAEDMAGVVCWMNPPFSKPGLILHFLDVVEKGVGIYRADNMETKVWQEVLRRSDWVHIFGKRINYEGKAGSGAVFGSALFGVGLPPPEGLHGTTVRKWEVSKED